MLNRSFIGQAPFAIAWFLIVVWKLSPDYPKAAKKSANRLCSLTHSLFDIDWLGLLFLAVGITTALSLMVVGGKKLPWSHPVMISMATICPLSILALILTEGHWAKKPIIPIELLKVNGFVLICVVQILLCAGRFGVSKNIQSEMTYGC